MPWRAAGGKWRSMSPSSVFSVTVPLAASIRVTSPIILCEPRAAAAGRYPALSLPAALLSMPDLPVEPLGVEVDDELPGVTGFVGSVDDLDGSGVAAGGVLPGVVCVPWASAMPPRLRVKTTATNSARTCRITCTSCTALLER